MKLFKTPEDRFITWIDYPYDSHYMAFEGARMHFVDGGDRDAPVILMVHGMPTSSYLYRHLIKAFVAQGYRCIAPDHIGFGKSDKVLDDGWYSIDKHQRALAELVVSLDLKRITVMVQDWGGPIGLRGPVDMPERYERLCILNTWLHHKDSSYNAIIRGWNKLWQPFDIPGSRQHDSNFIRNISSACVCLLFKFMVGRQPAGAIVYSAVHGGRGLSNTDSTSYQAYQTPFPDDASKAGARRMSLSLPFYNPEDGNAAVQEHCYQALQNWTKPAHFIWGASDLSFPFKAMNDWASVMPNTSVHAIQGAGHFLQESHHQEIVDILLAQIAEE